ncbi:hypothetical protein G647_01119 [Cladophialophora carrionii CBS 160.54]|uniref:Uncharacterized protein n=1 Tax=Cladophialophora carrionii CBS 160.54 TaxID=1279043 RepID=V9DQS6_9EURO|nr:uncharacterized protein G647_01119 [Cladophialophora carrionii CBS 160.54]ETI28668.1 hypothetical protein G647_01119 [Cladophialophora carrionii CBS 160.54]
MATAVTPTHRFSDTGHANWKCFPAPYVMQTEQQRSHSRSRSRRRSRNRHLSHSDNSPPHQWLEDPVQRPATAAPTVNHESAHPVPRSRSRSRLRKRSSQPAMKNTATTLAMSQAVADSQGSPSNQQNTSALPHLPQTIPERRSSLRRKPVASTTDQPRPTKEPPAELKPAPPTHGLLSIRPKPSLTESNTKLDSDSERSSSAGSIQSPTNPPRTPRHQPLAPNDPSPLNPRYYIPTSDFPSAGATAPVQSPGASALKNEHVLLPAGFRPGKTEHTYVEEVVKPAVTHEVIKNNKTEIVQEEITREIHVHHYYTYTQPIKAVEILPARHFIVDGQTGEKVEIPPPEGWVMPANMQPYKPDMSALAVETRHYLVDEEHPTGVPEPAPPNVQKRESQSELRKKTSMTGHWTPFPKVR